MVVDYVELAQDMIPGSLEKILEILPEPTRVNISVYQFDFSDIYNQAEEIIPGLKLSGGVGSNFHLENPSKEKILEIYKKQYNTKERKKKIVLDEILWIDSTNKSNIKLTPNGVNIEYRGKGPDYVSKLIRYLEKSYIGTVIELNR